jgi:phosphatidylserine/phosphatidylglycerophosphate/cardiolipin synthase-like enzyme
MNKNDQRKRKLLRFIAYFTLTVITTIVTGCSSLPKRNVELTQSYKLLAPSITTNTPPILSAYTDISYLVFKENNYSNTMHYAAILDTGDDALLTRVHLIRAARESIDIQTFIWKQDQTSDFLFYELLKAAQRGVQIRLLIDALNHIAPPKQLARMAIAHKNFSICLYRPTADVVCNNTIDTISTAVFRMRRFNRRMHNKTFIVDNKIGIAGGRNYEGKYFDRDSTFIFKDRDMLLISPIVTNMTISFNKFWNNNKSVNLLQFKDVQGNLGAIKNSPWKYDYKSDKYNLNSISILANTSYLGLIRPQLKLTRIKSVRFASDTPRKFDIVRPKNEMSGILNELVPDAKDYLFFQTPYLIYNKAAKKSIKKIRKKNPELKVIFSSNSLAAADHINVFALSYKHRKKLYKKMGLDIYEFKPFPEDLEIFVPRYKDLINLPMEKIKEYVLEDDIAPIKKKAPRLSIHAKTFIMDDQIALIGSHNFDPRSAKYNTECGILVKDKEFCTLVANSMVRMIDSGNSWIVGKRIQKENLISKFSGFIGAVSSALPIFDVWPFQYTSVYELRKNGTPMLSRDPDFYKNYRDVGQFPEVNSANTDIKTRLFKAFGGWSNHLM